LGFAKSTYYFKKIPKKPKENSELVEQVKFVHNNNHQIYGRNKLLFAVNMLRLKNKQIPITE
jgi:hypothetical protein